MSEKRRDDKGRLLRVGESQRSDGRYSYKYKDIDGKYRYIYSNRLEKRPAFQMAVEDELIKKNPFSFELHTVVVNDSKKRDAISRKEERLFLEFVKNDPHFGRYYEAFFILFNTGLRISEFCGLTKKDIDFKNKCIKMSRSTGFSGKKEKINKTA